MAEDLGAVGKRLTAAERDLLAAHVSAHAKTACHQCGICESVCPEGIEMAGLARCLAYLESYGKAGRARAEYAGLAASVSACRDCGACERACPYGLAVRERTRRAAALFA
jgi:predicted aldo/keto reductase-like oxidoreductase